MGPKLMTIGRRCHIGGGGGGGVDIVNITALLLWYDRRKSVVKVYPTLFEQ